MILTFNDDKNQIDVLRWLKTNVCADKTRGNLCVLHMSGEREQLEATDGKCAAIYRCPSLTQHFEPGMYDFVKCTKGEVVLKKASFEGSFPDLNMVIPVKGARYSFDHNESIDRYAPKFDGVKCAALVHAVAHLTNDDEYLNPEYTYRAASMPGGVSEIIVAKSGPIAFCSEGRLACQIVMPMRNVTAKAAPLPPLPA